MKLRVVANNYTYVALRVLMEIVHSSFLTAHIPDCDPSEDMDGDEPDWPLFEEVCELRPGVCFSCQVSTCRLCVCEGKVRLCSMCHSDNLETSIC